MLNSQQRADRPDGSASGEAGRPRRPWLPARLAPSTGLEDRTRASSARKTVMLGNVAAPPDVTMPPEGPPSVAAGGGRGGGFVTRPLRVLHVSEVHWGGVVTLLRHFVHEQDGAGHEVHLLAPSGMGELPSAHLHRWNIDRSRPSTFPGAWSELRQVVRTVSPDVIHLHSYVAGLLGRSPGALPAGSDTPVVYQPHAWSTQVFASRLASRALTMTERMAASRTDMLVANCQDEIDAGKRLGVDIPARGLGVTVDLAHFRPPSEDERRRHRRDLGLDGKRVLLVLGRITRQKGQDLLVAEWESRRPGADHLLLLVGPGDTAQLQTLAPTTWGRSIRAVGEPDDVLPWLRSADLLLLPSRYETVGLVVAEAMATGLPVVATAVDGALSTIVAGPAPAAGAVVAAGDMRNLLDEARRRLDDPALRAAESAAGRLRSEQMFRPDVVAGRLETAYRDAIASKKKEEEVAA
jgi:glycosyltransferase involved in cell wall biosynthesis